MRQYRYYEAGEHGEKTFLAARLDQLRTVDRERLVKRLGALPSRTLAAVLGALQEMSAE